MQLSKLREYVDEDVSGAKEWQPTLKSLLVDANRRQLAVLLVWKLDGRTVRMLYLRLKSTQGNV